MHIGEKISNSKYREEKIANLNTKENRMRKEKELLQTLPPKTI